MLEGALMMISSHPFSFLSMKTSFWDWTQKMSKTSKLNFSENLNKEQLDINFNHLRSNSSIMNMQICPQWTKIVRCPDCIGLGFLS